MNLSGKIAIVTGAGQGMGRGIAEKLAKEGASVFVTGRTFSKVEETAELINRQGFKAVPGQADISNLDDIKRMFDECEKQLGQADILIANAGIAPQIPIKDVTPEIFEQAFNTNARGTLFCLKEAGARLKDEGSIVCVSSSSVSYPVPGMCVYSSSKAAINLMAEVAAQEFSERKIQVNVVQPGLTITPAFEGTLPEVFMNAMIEKTAMKRLGMPEDIAGAVALLCSDDARWINGQSILVNGGCFG